MMRVFSVLILGLTALACSGQLMASGAENPAAVGLMQGESKRSQTPIQSPVISLSRPGPEGMLWTPNARFLYLADPISRGRPDRPFNRWQHRQSALR